MLVDPPVLSYKKRLDAGHNDIEVFPEYLERLKRLINEDLSQ